MKSLVYRITAWPLTLSFFIGIVFSGIGGMLCLGDNGYIKIEPMSQPSCSQSAEMCIFEVSYAPHDHHNCRTDCTDFPLEDLNWLRRISKTNSIEISSTTPNPVLMPCISIAGEDMVSRLSLPDGPIYHPSSPAFLSTTILIC